MMMTIFHMVCYLLCIYEINGMKKKLMMMKPPHNNISSSVWGSSLQHNRFNCSNFA